MEKRIFIAVLISLAFLWLWAAVAPKLFPELVKQPPKPAAVTEQAPATSTSTAAAATTSSTTTQPPAAPAPAVVPAAAPIAAAQTIYTLVETPEFVARFSNRGAQLTSFQLKQYREKDGSPLELVKAREATRDDFPFAIETRDAAVNRKLNGGLYSLTDRTDGGHRVLEYRWSDGRISATKTFRIGAEYLFDFSSSVSPATPYRLIVGPGLRTLAGDEKDSQFIVTGNAVVQREGKLKVVNREKADVISNLGPVEYIGVEDNYFLVALKPTKAGEGLLTRIELPTGPKTKRRDLYVGLNAAPDGTIAGSAFFGPKQTQILDQYGLEKTLQFGMFGVIARVLLTALMWINGYVHNYGWAIVLLTVIIKLLLYPLQHKQNVSMKKMQRLQPKMEAIRNRYKKSKTDVEQRNKMNQEIMGLYQKEGINPMGGCWPILLQVPILWGFYGLLSRSIELRGAPWILWIHDLSTKDPYYVLPLLMTITMFIQQTITPATGDAAQRRMFLIMPLIFGWIFKEFPSGLVLYWLVQNILTIAQMMIMNKYWKEHPDDAKPQGGA
ncbi:MAG TPA: membrane protein insertase YidC [Thermoanaerobaculia bacterium]|jgi:YidC/Oxa1 family membrane protein insertase|nr:membrane protein insertase YidC [Thermoanaerobaculia bacterium]